METDQRIREVLEWQRKMGYINLSHAQWIVFGDVGGIHHVRVFMIWTQMITDCEE